MVIHPEHGRLLLMQLMEDFFFLIHMMNQCFNTQHRNLIQTLHKTCVLIEVKNCGRLNVKELRSTPVLSFEKKTFQRTYTVGHAHARKSKTHSRPSTQASPKPEANTYIERHFPSAQLHLWNKTSADIELTMVRHKVQQPCDHSLFILGYIWQPL